MLPIIKLLISRVKNKANDLIMSACNTDISFNEKTILLYNNILYNNMTIKIGLSKLVYQN